MTDEPGEPVSPHGDSEPMPSWILRDSRPPEDDGTGMEGTRGYTSPLEAPRDGAANGGPGPADYLNGQPGDNGRPYDSGRLYDNSQPYDNGQPYDRPVVTSPPPRAQPGGPPGTRGTRGQDPWSEIRHLSATGPEAMPIGIWGSPASGKSTYLAALQHATGNASRSLGTWSVYARTEQSAELLSNWNAQLVGDHKFPEATDIAAATPLRWRFKGDLAGSRYQPLWRRLRRIPEPSAFDLDLIDVSGEVFGPRPADKEVPRDVVTRTLDHLANARGLIFLFDPLREREEPTVVNYLNRTLTQLARRVEGAGRTTGLYLPHYISVCVTKFDDQMLFQQACKAGFVNSGPDGIPRVLDKHAELFFDALCQGTFWGETDERGSGGPKFVRAQLKKFFHPSRIRYFVTSSIGFNLGADGRFDPARYSMVREQEKNNQIDKRIIGTIEPINVLEPLVDLYMKLHGRS
jgi:hypothetical protein